MNKLIIYLFLLSSILMSCNNVVRANSTSTDEKSIVEDYNLTESENYNDLTTCEDAKQLAVKDIEDGQLKYIFGSYGSQQELPKNLERLYGIEIIKVKGSRGKVNGCYNDIMYKEIQRKFGTDAFNKAME